MAATPAFYLNQVTRGAAGEINLVSFGASGDFGDRTSVDSTSGVTVANELRLYENAAALTGPRVTASSGGGMRVEAPELRIVAGANSVDLTPSATGLGVSGTLEVQGTLTTQSAQLEGQVQLPSANALVFADSGQNLLSELDSKLACTGGTIDALVLPSAGDLFFTDLGETLQEQLDAKLDASGGELAPGASLGVDSADAIVFAQENTTLRDELDALLPAAGGTMGGALVMPSAADLQFASGGSLETLLSAGVSVTGDSMTGTLNVPQVVIGGSASLRHVAGDLLVEGADLLIQGTLTADAILATSDRRLKSNIRSIDPSKAASAMARARARLYTKDGFEEAGFIAQELLEIPELAHTVHEGSDGLYRVDYNGVLTHAIAALQHATAIEQQQPLEWRERVLGDGSVRVELPGVPPGFVVSVTAVGTAPEAALAVTKDDSGFTVSGCSAGGFDWMVVSGQQMIASGGCTCYHLQPAVPGILTEPEMSTDAVPARASVSRELTEA